MTEFLYLLLTTHITIICVTVFLHRGQAHRGLTFSPLLSHLMRFWLWLTTGMVTKQWVAIHRKHHKDTDVTGDPHSPAIYGIVRVLFGGAFLYHHASKDTVMVNQFGVGTPDDWLERNVYAKHSRLGVTLLLLLNLLCFSWWGLLVWVIQMIWIPFWAAGVLMESDTGAGYRNGITKDNSRNISPLGIIIGGEELHNNHHLDPANPKLSRQWFEIDMGWVWIQIFKFTGLLKIRTL
jgi:stearoyl-CoA desaturase (Delta-9 desaturase)